MPPTYSRAAHISRNTVSCRAFYPRPVSTDVQHTDVVDSSCEHYTNTDQAKHDSVKSLRAERGCGLGMRLSKPLRRYCCWLRTFGVVMNVGQNSLWQSSTSGASTSSKSIISCSGGVSDGYMGIVTKLLEHIHQIGPSAKTLAAAATPQRKTPPLLRGTRQTLRWR